MRNVDGLDDEHDKPVDENHHTVEAESCQVEIILSPDIGSVAVIDAVAGFIEGVVNGGNNGQKPCYD